MSDYRIKIFFSYSHRDTELRDELEDHLSSLKRQGKILAWHDQKILPGSDWRKETELQLGSADIILLLISSSFIASDFCFCVELEQARKRHELGEARIIPIFLKPIDLQALDNTPLRELQGLPSNSKPVTQWDDVHEALSKISEGVRIVVDELQQQKISENGFVPLLQSGIQTALSEERIKLREDLRSAPENTHSILQIFQNSILSITAIVRQYLCADRVTVFFLNIHDQELWSLVAEGNERELLEIIIPIGKGFAGKAAKIKKPINIGFDLYEHPDSGETRKQDQKNNYRTYTLLTMPVLDDKAELIAVIQFLNKLKKTSENRSSESFINRIDQKGFTEEDYHQLQQAAPWIKETLQDFQDFYSLASKIEIGQKRLNFTRYISENKLISSSENVDEFLWNLMDATRQVTRADRCTLWLLNQEEQKLWTHILVKNGLEEHLEYRELILKKHVSAIAVQVANSKQTRNIEYDFYDSSDAVVAIELDKKNNYRTCSLLCMPVLDEQNSVIGVTQLVNKTCTGSFSEYNHQTYPMAPAQWRTHFSKADERRMRELNEQIANVIESFNYLSKIEKDENLLNALAWLTKVSADCLSADRATIFLLNEDRTHLWSLIADDGQGGSLEEIEVPVDGSLAGEVVRTKKILKIDSDFYQDSRSITSQK